MKIVCIGGGPAGLYFAILMKKALPGAEITVYERNRPDDTFGWGVVFSDETLGDFERADPESFAEITASFRYWKDIETFYGGELRGLDRARLRGAVAQEAAADPPASAAASWGSSWTSSARSAGPRSSPTPT